MSRFKVSALKLSRDSFLFVSGIAGIAYETLAHNGDQPTLLVLFGAMIGLPAFLHTDEKVKATPVTEPVTALPPVAPLPVPLPPVPAPVPVPAPPAQPPAPPAADPSLGGSPW